MPPDAFCKGEMATPVCPAVATPVRFVFSGRTRVLDSLLAKSHLFETPLLRSRYEALARFNLKTEVAQLKERAAALSLSATADSGSAGSASERKQS